MWVCQINQNCKKKKERKNKIHEWKDGKKKNKEKYYPLPEQIHCS